MTLDRYSNDKYDDFRGSSRENTYDRRNFNAEKHESLSDNQSLNNEKEPSRKNRLLMDYQNQQLSNKKTEEKDKLGPTTLWMLFLCRCFFTIHSLRLE